VKRKNRAPEKVGVRRPDGTDLSQADYERLAQFRYLLRHFLIFSETAAEQAGLTPQQHQALLAIKGHREPQLLTAGVLAQRLAILPHSAVGLIDRLELKGLIHRAAVPEDRRRVLVELTGAAEVLLRDLTMAHRDELERLAPLLRSLLRKF
jgi:DNA-binding MarR family transcriptional regulator